MHPPTPTLRPRCVPRSLSAQGQSKVEEVRPGTPADRLHQLLGAWACQPRFALALYLPPPPPPPALRVAAPGSSAAADSDPHQRQQQQQQQLVQHQAPAALAVCWESQGCYFLDISPRHLARRLEGGGSLRAALAALLASPSTTKLLFNLPAALPALAAAGLRLAGPVEDPRVAAWLLAPDAPPADASLRGLHAKFARQLAVRVPALARGGVSATARAALLTLALAQPLRTLLAARGMVEVFERLEMPAALAAAELSAAAAAGGSAPAAALESARNTAAAAADAAQRCLREALRLPIQLSDGAFFAQLLGVRGLGGGGATELPCSPPASGAPHAGIPRPHPSPGALRLPQPPRPKRGPPPAVPLEHLQELLASLRPRERQGQQRAMLELLVQYSATQARAWDAGRAPGRSPCPLPSAAPAEQTPMLCPPPPPAGAGRAPADQAARGSGRRWWRWQGPAAGAAGARPAGACGAQHGGISAPRRPAPGAVHLA